MPYMNFKSSFWRKSLSFRKEICPMFQRQHKASSTPTSKCDISLCLGHPIAHYNEMNTQKCFRQTHFHSNLTTEIRPIHGLSVMRPRQGLPYGRKVCVYKFSREKFSRKLIFANFANLKKTGEIRENLFSRNFLKSSLS